jgi:hypothetical protein
VAAAAADRGLGMPAPTYVTCVARPSDRPAADRHQGHKDQGALRLGLTFLLGELHAWRRRVRPGKLGRA